MIFWFFWILNFLDFRDSIFFGFLDSMFFWFLNLIDSFFVSIENFCFLFHDFLDSEFSKFSGCYFLWIYDFLGFRFFLYLNMFWLFWILTCLDFLRFQLSFSRTWIFRKFSFFQDKLASRLKVGSVLGPFLNWNVPLQDSWKGWLL